MGARESLNGRKNIARRKVKNDEKSPFENTRGKIYGEIENLALIDQSQQVCLILLQMPGL